jgi:uncharacterized lipoprotein YmbA
MSERTGKVVNAVAVLPLAAVACLVLACSSPAPPERAYYLLRAEVIDVEPPATPDLAAGIDSITVAPYLDRAGLVIGVGANEIREARFHLWAEPLSAGIRYYLQARISSDLGYRIGGGARRSWQKKVRVEVREFHGDQSGGVRLVAGVSVTGPDGAVIADEEFAAVTTVSQEGYAALVAAQMQLLEQLADAITPLLR